MPPSNSAFLNLSEQDKIAYLSEKSPAFTKLSPQDKSEYIRHMTSKMQPAPGQTSVEKAAPQSTYDKLTAPGSRGGTAENIPYVGPVLRAFDAAGGAALGLPGSIYHAFADPVTDGRSKWEAVPERLLGGEATAGALRDYGAGKVSPSAALSVLPEAIGTGAGTVSGTGLAAKGLGAITRPGLASTARLGSKVADFDLTKPLSFAKPALEHIADKLENKAPIERDATALNKIPFAGEEVPPELGTPENPGLHNKIPLKVKGNAPTTVGPSVITKENPANALGELPRTSLPQAEVLQRVPNAGENQALRQFESSDSTALGRIGNKGAGTHPNEATSSGLQPIQPFPRPLRPLVGSPEDWQAFDRRMSILTPEAKAAGMYSAARGKVENIPDYQSRIGNRLRPFGSEEEK